MRASYAIVAICYILCTIVVLVVIVVLLNHFGLGGSSNDDDPTFSIESSTVKAYNLTSADDRLFCIINLGVRVRNRDPRKHSLGFYKIDMEVRKGHHHKLADDAISDFHLGPGVDALVNVEAVGLQVALEREIAGEVRADAAAGEGRVNVFMTGGVGAAFLDVTCKGVTVDFSRSTVRVQKVDCGVSVTSSDSGGD